MACVVSFQTFTHLFKVFLHIAKLASGALVAMAFQFSFSFEENECTVI